MNIPFQVGQEYPYNNLAQSVGSAQKQSGIIWEPKKKNTYGFIIVTSGGNKSKSLGYKDKRNSDGSWLYYGQKNTNTYGNKILKNGHSSVLLFTTREATNKEVKERGNRSKRYQYEGVFMVAGYEYEDINNEQRIRFRLIPTLNAPNQIATDSHLNLDSSKMHSLRAKLQDYQEPINPLRGSQLVDFHTPLLG